MKLQTTIEIDRIAKRIDSRAACQQDVLDLACFDATIGHFVQAWRRGAISWEQMLMSAVVYLSGEASLYREETFQMALRATADVAKLVPAGPDDCVSVEARAR